MIYGEQQKLECLRLLIRPFVRFALRHSISVQQMIETLKHAVVRIAAEEIERSGKKVNVSRLSAMTGLHRRDVDRLHTVDELPEVPTPLAARVVSQWENDRRFLRKNGLPRVLRLGPDKNEFLLLLRAVSTDLNPGTVLFELERSGVIKRGPDSVTLVRAHIVPKENVLEGFRILERDYDDLIRTVEENIIAPEDERTLHGRTEFDNISPRDLPEIRRWIIREGGAFHEKVRKYLSTFDLDHHPERGGPGGARVSLTTFSKADGASR